MTNEEFEEQRSCINTPTDSQHQTKHLPPQLLLIFLSRSVRFSNPTTSLCFSVAWLIAVISYQAQEKLTMPFGPFRLQPLGCFNPTQENMSSLPFVPQGSGPVPVKTVDTHEILKGISKERKKEGRNKERRSKIGTEKREEAWKRILKLQRQK